MDKGFLEDLQQIAQKHYNAVGDGTPVEAMWHVNIVLAEIALQLAKQNAQLERIADRLDDIGKDMSAVNLSDL